MKNIIRKFFRWIPENWKAKYDYLFDKSVGNEFQGPFNGQIVRQGVFRSLLQNYKFKAIAETGTFRGVTTRFLAMESGLPVFTVEAMPRYFHYAKMALRRLSSVKIFLGDSREFIKKLSADSAMPKKDVFFYLDAHWHEDLPLYQEVELIGNCWSNAVILIDDFEVPGDAGYLFDDYGNGKRLNLKYISPLLADKWEVFFPSVPSSGETGIKRGYVILASKAIAERVAHTPNLKQLQSS